MQQMQEEQFGIVFKIFAIVLAFSLGVAVGGQPIIGFNYGAKQYKRVLETYKIIIIANITVGAISMLLFEFVPNMIVNLFGGHANNLEFYQEYACLSFKIYLGGILLCCIQKVSENYNIDMKMLETVDEKQKSSFWYSFATNYVFSDNNEVSPVGADDNLFLKQARVIEDLYNNEESSIIIGRCSDYILKNKPNVVKLFIYSSDMDFKINRKMKYENLNKVIAEKKIEQVDKQRSEYYKRFTSQVWGDKMNYDLCVDTSKLGVDDTIDVLEEYIRKRIS